MILVDTSVWVDHFNKGDPALAARLNGGEVLMHPLVIEELACGQLRHREEILSLLAALPQAPVASHDEVVGFISEERLHGCGIGAVDAHLLASARLAKVLVWSRDKALCQAATVMRGGILSAVDM